MKNVNKGVIDQYHLIHTAISIFNKTPWRLWTTSFQHVGIDPLNRPMWDEWIEKIKPFLQGGTSFNREGGIDVNAKYDILPQYFHGVSIYDNKLLMEITEKYNKWSSLECVKC